MGVSTVWVAAEIVSLTFLLTASLAIILYLVLISSGGAPTSLAWHSQSSIADFL
jgi:hypothetical protein